MQRVFQWTLISVTIVTLGACGSNRSLSEHQCTAGDWHLVGVSDGRRGYDQSRLLKHQNACGPHGVVPDSQTYREGWYQGIAEFCEPGNGYSTGVAGNPLPRVCPEPHRAGFQQAYNDGRRLFLARSEVEQIETSIQRTEARMDAITSELVEIAAAQIVPDLATEERIALGTRAQKLLAEQRRLRHDLPELHARLDDALRYLADVEATTPQLARSF